MTLGAGLTTQGYKHLGNILGSGEGGGSPATYQSKILALNPLAYWPLNDAAGPQATDVSGNSLHGTYDGVTLGVEGIGDGQTAASFDGINDLVDIYSASLNTLVDMTIGSLFIWAKPVAGILPGGNGFHYPFTIGVDGNNRVILLNADAANTFWFQHNGSAVVDRAVKADYSSTDWNAVGLTWSESADELKGYYNGLQEDATKDTLGSIAGALGSTICVLGSSTNVGADLWEGRLAHAMIWDRVLSDAEILSVAVNTPE